MNVLNLEECELLADSKYRAYISQVEKALRSFEYTSEWADLISALGKLNKVLMSHVKYPVIPKRVTIGKRLAQCLHPALPGGVHLKALETYDIIFKCIGSPRLARDLFTWSAGLFPLLAFAAMNVKPALLSIYETHFVPLGRYIKPALTGLLLALLPGLEEGSEYFERTSRLLEEFSLSAEPTYFYGCLWECVLASSTARLPAINYVLAHYNRRQIMEDQLHFMGTNIDMLVETLCVSVQDSSVLVQRSALDLLLCGFPMHNSQLTRPDMVRLMSAVIKVVLRRDMSLNRRLNAWLLGTTAMNVPALPARTESKPASTCRQRGDSSSTDNDPELDYFEVYSRQILIQAVRNCIDENYNKRDSSEGRSANLMPFRILMSLLDKPEIGSTILEDVLMDIFLCMYREYMSINDNVRSNEDKDNFYRNGGLSSQGRNGRRRDLRQRREEQSVNSEIIKTANLLFGTFEPYYIWDFIARTFDKVCAEASQQKPSKIVRSEMNSLSELCALVDFLLDKVSLESYMETQTEHIPELLRQMTTSLTVHCQQLAKRDLTVSVKLCSKMLGKVLPSMKPASSCGLDSVSSSMPTSPVKTPYGLRSETDDEPTTESEAYVSASSDTEEQGLLQKDDHQQDETDQESFNSYFQSRDTKESATKTDRDRKLVSDPNNDKNQKLDGKCDETFSEFVQYREENSDVIFDQSASVEMPPQTLMQACVHSFQKLFVTFVSCNIITDPELPRVLLKQLIVPSLSRDHPETTDASPFERYREWEDHPSRSQDIRRISISQVSSELSEAFCCVCQLLEDFSCFPLYCTSHLMFLDTNLNKGDEMAFPEWLQLLLTCCCFLDNFTIQSAAISTMLDLINLTKSVAEETIDTENFKMTDRSDRKSQSDGTVSVVIVPCLSPQLLKYLNTSTTFYKVVAQILWDYLGDETPLYHQRSVDLLFRMHQLAPSPWICEDVIGNTLLSDDKKVKIAAHKKFAVLWHLLRDKPHTVAAGKPARVLDRSLFIVLDSLQSDTHPCRALTQTWLTHAIQRGDVARILQPILCILLHPDTARISIQHVNIHQPQHVRMLSPSTVGERVDNTDTKIYAISSEGGNVIYHVDNSGCRPVSTKTSEELRTYALTTLTEAGSSTRASMARLETELHFEKVNPVDLNLRVNPFGSETSLESASANGYEDLPKLLPKLENATRLDAETCRKEGIFFDDNEQPDQDRESSERNDDVSNVSDESASSEEIVQEILSSVLDNIVAEEHRPNSADTPYPSPSENQESETVEVESETVEVESETVEVPSSNQETQSTATEANNQSTDSTTQNQKKHSKNGITENQKTQSNEVTNGTMKIQPAKANDGNHKAQSKENENPKTLSKDDIEENQKTQSEDVTDESQRAKSKNVTNGNQQTKSVDTTEENKKTQSNKVTKEDEKTQPDTIEKKTPSTDAADGKQVNNSITSKVQTETTIRPEVLTAVEDGMSEIDTQSETDMDSAGRVLERDRISSISSLHTHILLYSQKYDVQRTLYGLSCLRAVLQTAPRMVTFALATTSISNSRSPLLAQLHTLLVRHRRSVFGKNFFSEIPSDSNTTYRNSMYVEILLSVCLYFVRSYYPNLMMSKLTELELNGNKEVQILSCEILTLLLSELNNVVKDSGKGFATYIGDLLGRCKVQKVLLHCVLATVYNARKRIGLDDDGNISEAIISFNEQNMDINTNEMFQVKLLKLLLVSITLENRLKKFKPESETPTSLPPEWEKPKAMPMLSSLKYLQSRPVIYQTMFLSAILTALKQQHLCHMHRHWVSMVTAAVPYLDRALNHIVGCVVRQLCKNLEHLSQLYELGDLYRSGFHQPDKVPPDHVITLLEGLTTLCHYCLLDKSQQETSIGHPLPTSSNIIISDSDNTGHILTNLFNVFNPYSNSREPSPAKDAQPNPVPPVQEARRHLLSILPHILASLVVMWKAIHVSEKKKLQTGDDQPCWPMGVPKMVRHYILEFLSPISRHLGSHLMAAVAVVWNDRRQKGASNAKRVIPIACDDQLLLVDLVSDIRVLPTDTLIQTVKQVVKQPPSTSLDSKKKRTPLEVSMLQFFYAYIQQAPGSHLVDSWSSLLSLLKDALQLNLTAPGQFLLLAILYEFVQKIPMFEDKKDQRDLQEIAQKLLEACSEIAGASLEQTTWLRRNLAVKPGVQLEVSTETEDTATDLETDAPTISVAVEAPPIERKEREQNYRQYSVQALVVLAELTSTLLDVLYKSEEKEKVVPFLSAILHNVFPYLRNHRAHNLPSFRACSKMLAGLSSYQFARKAWKREVFELLMDTSFFQMDHVCFNYWRLIVDNLMTHEKTTFRDLLTRVSVTQGTSLNLFTSREQEFEQRAQLLKRLNFTLFCSEVDQYHKSMPDIQERLAESLRLPTVPSVQAQVFLCFRVLIVRVSPHHLVSLWPTIITELIHVLLLIEQELLPDVEDPRAQMSRLSNIDPSWSLGNGLNGPNHPSWLQLYLSACKLLDMALVLPCEDLPQFQLYRWAFIGCDPASESERPKELHPTFTPHVIRLASWMDMRYGECQPLTRVAGHPLLKRQHIKSVQDLHAFFHTLTINSQSTASINAAQIASSHVEPQNTSQALKSKSTPELRALEDSPGIVEDFTGERSVRAIVEDMLEKDFMEPIPRV